MTTVYPSAYDTLTDRSLGVTKADKETLVDANYQPSAAEWNNTATGILALERMLGDGAALPPLDGDVDEGNVRSTLDFLASRADKAGFNEHFTTDSTSLAVISIFVDDVGAAFARAQVAGGAGVVAGTSPAATTTAIEGSDDHFHMRSTYARFRFQVDALSSTDTDFITAVLFTDGNNYTSISSVMAGGAWPVWTAGVVVAAAPTTSNFTATPTAATWITMEILTTATNAHFWIDRGEATEEYELVSAAPSNAFCHPSVQLFSNAGGEILRVDAVSTFDTRTL
jgi:hypothetical protein